jgi:type IV pilus assembly protein PilY1
MSPQLLHRDSMRFGWFVAALGLALLFGPGAALAQQSPLVGFEDIDLFANPPAKADLPNVLLILDTSSNWAASTGTKACKKYADGSDGPVEDTKKVGVEKCGLVNALYGLPTNLDGSGKFNVGLMYLNASSANGGYPRMRFRELTAANKTLLMDEIKNTLAANAADQASNADVARGLWEAYLWYKGMAPYNGTAQSNASKVRWDAGAFDGAGNYISPSTNSCGRNYVILLANGVGQSTEDDIRAKIVAAGGNGTQIAYSSSYMSNNAQNNWADEASRFLHGADVSTKDGVQDIITFSLAVTDPSKDKPADLVNNYNYIKEVAIQGGGKYYEASDSGAMAANLRDIFDQISAVNSVFASASLPVSVNAQGTYLNQVFMGMFRPDEVSRPRWPGNLKQYQFAYDSQTQRVDLVDAAGVSAINPTTGFITPAARSFWTTAGPYTDFWKNKTWGDEVNLGGASDSPDGQIVEKGGAAQRLRELYLTSQTSRPVYTADSGALKDFNSTNVSQAALGAADATERDAILAWTRGTDNRSPSDEQGPGTVTSVVNGTTSTVTATVRGSIHGDVIHSSPAVINYGGTTGVVVFYGDNSGMLHAVRGAQAGTGAGNELWSFVPSEFLPKLRRLRNNTPKVQFAATNMTEYPDAMRKDYGMDGPITFYQKSGTGAAVWLFAGMRRGGRALYAFDITTPGTPTLKWKLDNSDIAALGQTWSEARVTRIKDVTDPVIIMGGGYDPGEDSSSPGTPAMGNVVIVLNARTGARLKVFTGIDRPVPASVAIVDTDGDGKMDRAYAVDMGGSVYRLTFPSTDPDAWAITKIADFSGSTGSGQKMFYAPAVTPAKMAGQTVYAVQVGTGDREKPLKGTGTDNRFFTVLDRGQTEAKVLEDLVQMTTTVAANGVVTSAGVPTIPNNKYGCYLNMPFNGEKVVNAVVYTSGYSFFGTNSPTPPSPDSCVGSLGVARSYAVPALCGPIKVTTLDGGGFPPTAVIGTVLIAPAPNANGQTIDCGATPSLCKRVPAGIGAAPPDCQGNASIVRSSIGASNIYACAPPQRLRRDWSIRNAR